MIKLLTLALSITLPPPAAGPEMEKLSFFIGEWRSNERMTAPGRAPIEFTLDGKYQWALNSTAITMDETLHLPDGVVSHNYIFLWWDGQAKNYRMMWFSEGMARPREFVGAYEGEKLVFVHTPEGGSGSALRIVYIQKSPTEFDATLDIQVEGKWQTRTVAKYTKKATTQP
ncbi:MAG: hypothetical protein HND42_04115 [Armatimonadetes bacterium]|nr:hypothetical protein [Armatimonadota bacterium]NOG92417.1 hypothetical protein [Armatimonadota bacterium]